MAGGSVPIIALTYVLAVVPLLLLCTNPCHKRIPKAVIYLYVAGFVLSALGWECWWTFGWVPPGQDVNHRRCPEDPSSCLSNQLLPPGINWIVTSLYDAGIVCMLGLWLVLQVWKKDVLAMWNWKVFVVFLVWFVGQNLIVELLISGQISGAEDENEIFVSWAPLSPIGPHWNPSIKVIGEARLSVQNQIPWLLMTPLFYACCIAVYRRQHHQSKDDDDDEDDDDDDSKPTEQRMKETVLREEIKTAAIATNHSVDPESNASNGSEHPTATV